MEAAMVKRYGCAVYRTRCGVRPDPARSFRAKEPERKNRELRQANGIMSTQALIWLGELERLRKR